MRKRTGYVIVGIFGLLLGIGLTVYGIVGMYRAVDLMEIWVPICCVIVGVGMAYEGLEHAIGRQIRL
jgi:hypothetical protein